MSDVFISYKRENLATVDRLVGALRAEGVRVWWDRDIAPNAAWEATIEQQLSVAKLVVVAWSPAAVSSDNVKAEARWARQQGRLLQVFVEACEPPLFFGERQGVDLKSWTGARADPAFRAVLEAVRRALEQPTTLAARTAAPPDLRPTAAKPVEPLLAVLAFDNISGDPEMVYFSDGVSEEIQQTVARGVDLKVIGRASSFQFRGADKAAAHVGAELGATHVLDGSVRRSGARVRISAQLIECAKATTLWSDRFDGDLTDAFALQDEIAAAVALALRKTFAPSAEARPVDPKAYDFYLRARALFLVDRDQGRIERVALGAEMLENAVALAPAFSRAWAELALARAVLLRRAPASFPELTAAQVREAAQTALTLDPGAGVAYTALGHLAPFGRYQEREILYGKALAASPTDPQILNETANLLRVVGRTREALPIFEQACDLDPLYWPAARSRADTLHEVGRREEALKAEDACLARWPEAPGIVNDAIVHAAEGPDWNRFDALVAKVAARGFESPRLRALIEYYEHLRRPDPAYVERTLRAARRDLARTGTVLIGQLLGLHSLGAEEAAFELVDQASFAHMFDPDGPPPAGGYTPAVMWLPLYAPMRCDRRFVDLCAKLGLCDYWVKSGRWPDCADEGVLPYDFKAACERRAGAAA
jgi:TolB-like protein